jgi:hypothetical protein
MGGEQVLRVARSYTSGDIALAGGETVTALSDPHVSVVTVALPPPYLHALEPFSIPASYLEGAPGPNRSVSSVPAGDVAALFPALQMSMGSQAAAGLSKADLSSTADALKTQIATLPNDSAEQQAARANLSVVEGEGLRRELAQWQLDDNAQEIAARRGGPPVVFALDETTNELYASVAAGGATWVEIATYIYGSSAEAGALAIQNGTVAFGRLEAGAPVKLTTGRRSAIANAAIDTARHSGTLLRTKGKTDLGSKSDLVYSVPVPGGVAQLNTVQFNSMLDAARRHTRGLVKISIESIEFLKGLRDDHEENTNSVVRAISDWSGDVELPGWLRYADAIARGNQVLAKLDGLEFDTDPRTTAAKLAEIDKQATEIMIEEARIDGAWHDYITGTIHGAEKTVRRLEVVRNVSFTAVAGMAGAVAAPYAFAALTTPGVITAAGVSTTTATGLSIFVVGGGTGAVTRAGLEVALPGAQADKPWLERAESGAWSGYVAGGIGAAGSFLTPAVSGSVSGQLASRTSQGFVQSTTGQVITRSTTGLIIGAPSGALSAGVENLPALATGRISGGDYAASVGWGTAGGAVFGAALSNLPISGFARAGMPFNPNAPTFMPEWMLAGPYSPLAELRGGTTGFNNLPLEGLPAFADDPGVAGYTWTRVRSGGTDRWVPMHMYGPKQQFEVAPYADPTDPSGLFNYGLLYGPPGNPNALRLVGSRLIQRPAGQGYQGMQPNDPFPGAPRSTRRDFPMTADDFEATLPDGTTVRMIRGHQVDFFDTTARTTNVPDSNLDVRNFTPEPREWGGLGGRNRLTMRIRNSGTGTQIRQINMYGRSTVTTASGSPSRKRSISSRWPPMERSRVLGACRSTIPRHSKV